MLEEDQELQEAIMKKIQRQEKFKIAQNKEECSACLPTSSATSPYYINLTILSIVGVKEGTRKRPRRRLSGSWWKGWGCAWRPGDRFPWMAGLRRFYVAECST